MTNLSGDKLPGMTKDEFITKFLKDQKQLNNKRSSKNAVHQDRLYLSIINAIYEQYPNASIEKDKGIIAHISDDEIFSIKIIGKRNRVSI